MDTGCTLEDLLRERERERERDSCYHHDLAFLHMVIEYQVLSKTNNLHTVVYGNHYGNLSHSFAQLYSFK